MKPQEQIKQQDVGLSVPVQLWTIPDHKALNERLRGSLLAMAETVPDTVTNSAYGESYFENKWLSKPDLHQNPDPDIQAFCRIAETAANDLVGTKKANSGLSIHSMWCIVGQPGVVGRQHNHRGKLSGAYYVDAGNPAAGNGGNLQFFAPDRATGKVPDNPTHAVIPKPGLMVLFPSELMHRVPAYTGTDPRIVISFNLR